LPDKRSDHPVKRILTWLFWGPLAIIIIVIAVANRHQVTFSLDPISRTDPIFALEMPLFVLLLGAVLLGLLIGGIASWLNQGKWRRAAREGLSEAAHWRQEAAKAQPRDEGNGDLHLPAPGAR